MSTILVTGGAGYIGSHTTLALLENEHDVVVIDNLSNSCVGSLHRVEQICGKKVTFHNVDILDKQALQEVFNLYKIEAVIHFAALKAVGESGVKPLKYYSNNVTGTLNLLELMAEFNVNSFIFSSSATVYGEENPIPYVETMKLGTPSSPYGASKVMIERVLADAARANPKLRAVSLRYFNPIGAHSSGLIGEDPKGIPNNLLPYVAQVAVGKLETLRIFGDDYPTMDGTCERDYLHVMDLAEGHVAAFDWLTNSADFRGVEVFNLGTGKATSVLAIVKAFEQASGKNIPYVLSPRRDGDLPAFWADADKAAEVLGWHATRSLQQMMRDTWRWQSQNTSGFNG